MEYCLQVLFTGMDLFGHIRGEFRLFILARYASAGAGDMVEEYAANIPNGMVWSNGGLVVNVSGFSDCWRIFNHTDV